jgi:hypothetical protein
MTAHNVVLLMGWVFLLVSFLWPNTKWGGTAIKIGFSALSTGLFVANAIHYFLS